MTDVPPPPPGGTPPPPPPGSTPPPPPGAVTPGYGSPSAPPPPGGVQPPLGFGQPYVTSPLHEKAGFWIRFGGYLLDGLLYGLVLIPFVAAGGVLIAVGLDDCVTINDELVCNGREDGGSIAGGLALMFVGFVVMVVLYLRALARSGQTWGRRIVGIKVVRVDNGLAPGWGKAIGRSLFSYISSWLFYLGYLWMIWDSDKQTWHDKVAGTYVVRA